jgi:hypothetical protein
MEGSYGNSERECKGIERNCGNQTEQEGEVKEEGGKTDCGLHLPSMGEEVTALSKYPSIRSTGRRRKWLFTGWSKIGVRKAAHLGLSNGVEVARQATRLPCTHPLLTQIVRVSDVQVVKAPWCGLSWRRFQLFWCRQESLPSRQDFPNSADPQTNTVHSFFTTLIRWRANGLSEDVSE